MIKILLPDIEKIHMFEYPEIEISTIPDNEDLPMGLLNQNNLILNLSTPGLE